MAIIPHSAPLHEKLTEKDFFRFINFFFHMGPLAGGRGQYNVVGRFTYLVAANAGWSEAGGGLWGGYMGLWSSSAEGLNTNGRGPYMQ